MRDYPDNAKSCDSTQGMIRKQTLREKLEYQIGYSNSVIESHKAEIKENEKALKVLNDNKNLETLVNLINR